MSLPDPRGSREVCLMRWTGTRGSNARRSNGAMSWARGVVIVVASPRLFQAECHPRLPWEPLAGQLRGDDLFFDLDLVGRHGATFEGGVTQHPNRVHDVLRAQFERE